MYLREDTVQRPNYRYKHIVWKLADTLPGIPKETVKRVLDAYRELTLKLLADGGTVHLLIGSVHLKYAQPIRRYSPTTGTVHDVPARWRCQLSPSTELKIVMADKPPYDGTSKYMHR